MAKERLPKPTPPVVNTPYLSPAQAAAFLNISPETLQRSRTRGDGPPFLRISPRRVAYLQKDLEAWAESMRRTSTVDPGPGNRR